MMRTSLTVTALFLSFVVAPGAAPSEAGSLAPYPLLGAISKAHLTVSAGDLGYESIPDLDHRALERQMRDRCERVLLLAGLEIAEPADAYFSVTVDHAWDGRERDRVALLVTVDLHVLAEPVDPASRALMHGRPTLTLWSDQHLELAPSADAGRVILEALDSALEKLVEARRAAQARAAESS